MRCCSSHSTRCITPAPQTEGSTRPTFSGSLNTPSPSPSLLSSLSASSTRTAPVASSQHIPTCPRASSISPLPSPSQTGRSPRRTRAPAPYSSETQSSRWSWTANRSELHPTEQCLIPTHSIHPTPVCRPGNDAMSLHLGSHMNYHLHLCIELRFINAKYLSQSAGTSSKRPFRHQCARSPGGLVSAAEAGRSSRGSSPSLQRGDWSLLPPRVPESQPQPSNCISPTGTPVLTHSWSASTSTSAARKCGQQECEEYKGEIPEAPAGVMMLLLLS